VELVVLEGVGGSDGHWAALADARLFAESALGRTGTGEVSLSTVARPSRGVGANLNNESNWDQLLCHLAMVGYTHQTPWRDAGRGRGRWTAGHDGDSRPEG
jgi:hypothetical protein